MPWPSMGAELAIGFTRRVLSLALLCDVAGRITETEARNLFAKAKEFVKLMRDRTAGLRDRCLPPATRRHQKTCADHPRAFGLLLGHRLQPDGRPAGKSYPSEARDPCPFCPLFSVA